MQLPLQISFRDFEPTAAIQATVRRKATHLEKFSGRLISCRVTLGEARKTLTRGSLYYCHVDLKIPGKEIAVGSHNVDGAHKNVYVAIRDAFDEAVRQLKEYVGAHRSRVHPSHGIEALKGRILRILHTGGADEDGYGFISASDGREIYFHRRSVLNEGFDRLKLGTEVRFSEEMGEEGPQASTVEILG